jgi:hypothetical protein
MGFPKGFVRGAVASGQYCCRLWTEDFQAVRKMLLLR